MKTRFIRFSTILKSKKKRGSAIVIVMILSVTMLMILASLLQRGTTSTRLNLANALYYEAKNAAESFAEYGCADLVKRFETKTSFPQNELKNNPIEIPSSVSTFYSGSNIDLSVTTVQGGEILNGYWLYIDPDDPRWEFDPMKGKKVFVRDINIFSKAVAKSDSMPGDHTAYVKQTLQVRDSPLFSNAIFYNMDLELHPGPVMNILGPVHSNYDAWLESCDKIYFYKTVTASGRILHGNPKIPTNIHNQTGKVYFKNDAGTFIDMRLGGSGSSDADWLDHRNADWRELSSQKWDGNVQDKDHNVPTYNAAGIKDNIPDNPYTAVSELENHAYAVIEPILTGNHPDEKSAGVRNQKMAAKAGLYFKVELDSTTVSGFRIKAYKWSRSNTSVPLNTQNPFDDLLVDGNGDPILLPIYIPNNTDVATLSGDLIGTASSDMSKIENDSEIPQPEIYSESSGYVYAGLYDHRQDLAISPVSIDIGVLRKVVDDNANATGTNLATTYWTDPSTGTVTYSPENDWNGVVYVEFPLENDSGGTVDHIVPAKKTMTVYYTEAGTLKSRTVQLALQIINGEYIPSPTFAPEPGLTIATNAPAYMVGNYNADGVATTDDSVKIEITHYKNQSGVYYDEPPSAVMSDCFTVLSNKWSSHNRKYSKQSYTSNRNASTHTEISVAILTGLKPTIPEGAVSEPAAGAQSGGAHNFPRFLENWTTELTIRTSMVALFESEVHTDAMPDNFSHYYSPPSRDWGFNENFDNGIYPPGTPNVRTFRRTTFSDISEEEYIAGTTY